MGTEKVWVAVLGSSRKKRRFRYRVFETSLTVWKHKKAGKRPKNKEKRRFRRISVWKQFTILIRSKIGAKAVHIPTLIFKDFRVLFVFAGVMFTE